MTELRDLRVPGLGLAPTKALDELYPRNYDPQIADFLRSRHRGLGLTALLGRLRTTARRGLRARQGVRRGARAEQAGFSFGRVAR